MSEVTDLYAEKGYRDVVVVSIAFSPHSGRNPKWVTETAVARKGNKCFLINVEFHRLSDVRHASLPNKLGTLNTASSRKAV